MKAFGDSWLDLYLEYTEPHEAPQQFHFWIGVSTLQACLQRNVWIKWSREDEESQVLTVHPYSYILLVAGSGRCRKTSAMRLAENLIREMEDPPPICAEQITKEALVTFIHKQENEGQAAYILSPEMTVTFSPEAVKSGIVQVLTRLYDGPDEFTKSTIARGNEKLREVCVNFLGATTPDELKKVLPVSAIGGGFMSRLIIVYQDSPKKLNAFPTFDPRLKLQLVQGLNVIRSFRGPVCFSDEAVECYANWYNNQDPWDSPELDGYFSRRHTHILKVAIALAASEGTLTITPQIFEKALQAVKALEPTLPKILHIVQASEAGDIRESVLRAIRRRGETGVSRVDLMRNYSNRVNAIELNDILNTLMAAKQIRAEQRGPKGGVWYVGEQDSIHLRPTGGQQSTKGEGSEHKSSTQGSPPASEAGRDTSMPPQAL